MSGATRCHGLEGAGLYINGSLPISVWNRAQVGHIYGNHIFYCRRNTEAVLATSSLARRIQALIGLPPWLV